MNTRTLARAAALAIALGCAAASGAPRTTLYAGLELGNHDSNRVDAGISVGFAEGWNAGASVARAHVEFPDERASSTLAMARLGRDLGAFSVGAGYRRGEIEGFSQTRGWLVSGDYVHRELRFGLEVESRDTTLEPTAFTADLGAPLGLVSGISHCRVDGRGYQGRVDWDRPTWSLFASLRVFDYDDYDCVLELTDAVPPPGGGNGNGNGPGPPPHARGRGLGRQLAAESIDDVLGAASRLVPREAALLESSAALGLTLPVTGEWIGGAELYRDVERIDGSETLTGLVFAGRRLSETWRIELSLGYSKAEEIEDTAFAGVRVTATL
jgi:hypothetical protein